MPKSFDLCVSKGGKVRTINPKKGIYLHICYINGKSFPGEIKVKKSE